MDNHCNLCDKSYKNKNSLGHHVRSVHRDAGAMCSLCGTNFKQRESLSRHIERGPFQRSLALSETTLITKITMVHIVKKFLKI